MACCTRNFSANPDPSVDQDLITAPVYHCRLTEADYFCLSSWNSNYHGQRVDKLGRPAFNPPAECRINQAAPKLLAKIIPNDPPGYSAISLHMPRYCRSHRKWKIKDKWMITNFNRHPPLHSVERTPSWWPSRYVGHMLNSETPHNLQCHFNCLVITREL